MNNRNLEVDAHLQSLKQWQDEFAALRLILLGCGLTEEYKWEQPCYTFDGNNIVLIHGFKDYCALLFFKGALLQDDEGILVQQTDNVQAGRQIRFSSIAEIEKQQPAIREYVAQAIAVEKAGLKVQYKPTEDFVWPEEFIAKLEEVDGLQDAFDALTPGRQRGYLLYFSAPTRSETRLARIIKCIPAIFEGQGLNDR